MKIRIELSEKEIRDLAVSVKPMCEIDGLEKYKADFDRDLNKIVERICSKENNIVVGHGYRGTVGNNAVRVEIDSRAVEMTALYVAKVLRRVNPVINSVIRFVKSMRELIGFTRETIRSDAEEFTSRFNRAFPVEREWKLVTVEQAHAACLYERVVGSTEWTNIQWTTDWQKVDDVMNVMDLHPSYRFFTDEDTAKAAFHEFLSHTNDPCNCSDDKNSDNLQEDDNDLYL